MLERFQVNQGRLSLEWVSAAEGPRFVTLITNFTEQIRELGPFNSSENLGIERVRIKLTAAKMALEGKRLRMVIARQAKYMKQGDTYREIPADHKLNLDWEKTFAEETVSHEMLLHLRERPRPVDELVGLLELSSEDVIDYFKKLEKKRLIDSDRLVLE